MTKSTIEFSAKLIVFLTPGIFCTNIIYFHITFSNVGIIDEQSLFTLNNIFKCCIENKHIFLEKISISIYKNNTTEIIDIPVCRAIAEILLNEYHLMNQTISHDISTRFQIPSILNIKYWLNIQSQLQDISLMVIFYYSHFL
ncbi:LOW QUALITY PROTEIN: hypothetical protein MXB_5032 [Myxobolus squamalis]|nr:LOW QUALITY PROTEIN: hypothetical protein MXB_5032 [Myxobolus squamalis]